CPDAYIYLSEAYTKGWGVRRNPKKALELMKKGAELGSPKALEFYGTMLIADPRAPGYVITRDQKMIAEGRKYLHRSLELGNGDAGVILSLIYQQVEHDSEGMIKSLRSGAKLGSKACLSELAMTYNYGDYGQPHDKAYGYCFRNLEDKISDFEAPKPIPNFDRLCPLKAIRPYKDGLGIGKNK
ncbi:MAG: hypothetical protein LBV21_05250, partial [Candidatus Adiutrix sp.]|nr:hypothetical protein [Candidatus Adiutrix sp.]